MPDILSLYNRYSIAVHFALGLISVAAVRDYDSTVISRSGCDSTKVAATE
jgi:hypothetical protein